MQARKRNWQRQRSGLTEAGRVCLPVPMPSAHPRPSNSRAKRWRFGAFALGLTLVGSSRATASPPLDQEQVGAALQVEVKSRLARPRAVLHELPRSQDQADAIKPVAMGAPSVHHDPTTQVQHVGLSWAHQVVQPVLADHRRRMAFSPLPVDFGHELRVGERFGFDVTYSGNPAGIAEVYIAAIEPDPRGNLPDAVPVVRVEGSVRTSGVLALLTTVTDHMTSWLDTKSGASVRNLNVIDQSGVGVTYKHRETDTAYLGRGGARMVDVRDRKVRKITRFGPVDTFDPMAAIAWVRALELAPGQRKQAHTLDGSMLLRLDIINRGPSPLRPLPGLVQALGINEDQIELYEGTLSRVDRHDEPIPNKRAYNFRAWVAKTSPRLLLALESDMWIGIVKIVLSRYDPPQAVSPIQLAP